MRDHPIPPVTEDLQYRAIGLVRAIYRPEDPKTFSRGSLLLEAGEEIEAVVLGKVISLIKRHIDIERPHLWVVYPRCRDSEHLHLQISGIWEPSTLDKVSTTKRSSSKNGQNIDSIDEGDDFFSIRGELIYTKPEENELVVKIRQVPKPGAKKYLPFKLTLRGSISIEYLRHFVSLEVRRKGQKLEVESFKVISQINSRGGSKKKKSRN